MGLNGLKTHRVVHHEALALLLLLAALTFTPKGALSTSQPCYSSADIFICRGQNLSAMPNDLSDLTWRLDLSFNAIASLTPSWTSRPLPRLQALVLAQNALVTVAPGAFVDATPHLRHLDLSSNRLESLDEGAFAGLTELEELLLYDNRLAQIGGGRVFKGLSGSLQRLHLGRNRLTEFPREMFDGVSSTAAAEATVAATIGIGGGYSSSSSSSSLSVLQVFDLSSNLLREVPVTYILSLPPETQAGIYLHDNPLVCTCAVAAMLQQWVEQRFRTMAMAGFLLEAQGLLLPSHAEPHPHPCLSGSVKDRLNCSHALPNSTHPTRRIYEAMLGESLLLSCLESKEDQQQGTSVKWDTPNQVTSPGELHKQHLLVHPNGSLQIQPVREEDAGNYTCEVISGPLQGATRVAQVVIVSDTTNPHEMTPTPDRGGSFHTAFTIMASWVVSMMLLMVYLYFSPRDLHKRWGRRNSASKKVVFVEPWMEVATLNQQTHMAAARNASGVVTTRSILKNGGSSTSSSVLASPAKEICPLI